MYLGRVIQFFWQKRKTNKKWAGRTNKMALWPWPAIKVKSAKRHGTIYHKQMIATSRGMKWRMRNWEWKWKWQWEFEWEGGQSESLASIQGWRLLWRGRGWVRAAPCRVALKRLLVKRIFISISCAVARWCEGFGRWNGKWNQLLNFPQSRRSEAQSLRAKITWKIYKMFSLR